MQGGWQGGLGRLGLVAGGCVALVALVLCTMGFGSVVRNLLRRRRKPAKPSPRAAALEEVTGLPWTAL